jgi:hypothetical protein
VYPGNKFKVAWDTIIMLLIIYTATWVPVLVSFYDSTSENHLILDSIVDIFFFIDIILNFFLAIDTGNGIYETDKSIIAKTYLISWFFIDVSTTIPYQLLDKLFESNHSNKGVGNTKLIRIARVSRLHRLIRIFKLLKVIRIFRARSKIGKVTKWLKLSNFALEMIRIVVITWLVNHLVCCLWYL